MHGSALATAASFGQGAYVFQRWTNKVNNRGFFSTDTCKLDEVGQKNKTKIVGFSASLYNFLSFFILSVIMVCCKGCGRVWHHKKKAAGDKIKGIAANEIRRRFFCF